MVDINYSVTKSEDYKFFIREIKKRIQSSQIKAAVSVNREMLKLYWFIGSNIVEKQKTSNWGDGLINQISIDLQKEFPNMKGFSETNLKYMKKWFSFFEKSPQVVGDLENAFIFQIPWGQNREIITKSKSQEEALFYVQKTIQNNWSRSVLIHQIEGKLFLREGKAISNFKATLPTPQSDLAIQIIKDPYNFDFLTFTDDYNERELQKGLVKQITKFLLELGTGFSFIAKEYKLNIADDEFYIDLLFYHVKLHSYVVLELKTGKFKPEFAGQLNFYVSAIDGIIKTKHDNPSIGILICKSKNNTVVEYALNGINRPIGVSEYTISKNLPETFKSSLPSIEEIEAELEGESSDE